MVEPILEKIVALRLLTKKYLLGLLTASGRLLPLRCQTNDGARLPFVGIRQRACFSKMHRVRAEHGASDAGGTQIKIGGVGVRWGPRLGEFEVPPPA